MEEKRSCNQALSKKDDELSVCYEYNSCASTTEVA